MSERGVIRTVTFDATGTLFEVRGSVGETYADVARRHGANLSPELLEASFRSVFIAKTPLAPPRLPDEELRRWEREWWRDLVREAVEPLGGVPGFDSFFEELFEVFRGTEGWKAFPEAQDVLGSLKAAGYRLGVISNFDSRLDEVLEALALRRYLDAVTASSPVGAAKPDPEIYEMTLSALDAEPEETLHVGDSLEEDWAGARAAGLEALLVDREGRYADQPGIEKITSLEGVLDYLSVPSHPARSRAAGEGE